MSIRGETYQHPRDMPKALRMLLSVWRYLQHFPTVVPPDSDSVDARNFPEIKILDALPQQVQDEFVTKVLGPIEDDAVLITTLNTWIFSNRSFSVASQRLKVHPNTIRYRIEKIAALTGIDVNDDREMMLIRLACMFLALRQDIS